MGIEHAAKILRTGRPFSSADAVEMGLCLEEVELERLVERAVELAVGIADGSGEIPKMPREALQDVPATLPHTDIGHLSRAVDALVCRAILEGARGDLTAGLTIENELFGEVCKTQDMKIGIENFLTKGPRSKAEFVHA